MFTPLEDIDLFHLLPYFSLQDLYSILLVHKQLPIEYAVKLHEYKYRVFCHFHFHEPSAFPLVRSIAIVKNNEDTQWLEVDNVEVKKDSNGISYLRILYANKVHLHIVYDRKVKFENEKQSLLLCD